MRLFTRIFTVVAFLFSASVLFAQHISPTGPRNTTDHFPGCGTDEHINYLRKIGRMPGPQQKGPLTFPQQESGLLLPGVRCNFDGGVPVVVHIIHLGEPIGTGSNISDAQVKLAIDGLNDWWANRSGNGVPLGISFQLAARDPNGNATNGITRTNGSSVAGYTANGLSHQSSPGASETDIKNLARWDQTSYYNIWVVHNINGSAAGYAYYPQATVFPNDGTVLEYNYMTYNSTVLAHELGHAFNLAHTFNGDASGCPANADCTTDGDGVCDTPPHRENDCGTSNPCPGGGIWNNSRFNIMSYCGGTDRFTAGQRDRVQFALRNTSRRTLVSSSSLVPVNNVREAGVTSLIYPTNILCGASFRPIVTIRNYGTAAVTSLTLEVYIDNVLVGQFTVPANIAPNGVANVELGSVNAPPGTHDLRVKLVAINGLMDETSLTDNQLCATVQRIDAVPEVCVSFEGATALPSAITTPDASHLVLHDATGVCATQESKAMKVDGRAAGKKDFSFYVGPIDLTGNANPKLNFDIARARDYFCNLFATVNVQISADCGKTYTTIYNKNDANAGCPTPPSTPSTPEPLHTVTILPGGPTGSFVPAGCNEWRSESLNLGSYSGQTVLLRFEVTFEEEDKLNNVVYFDNICLRNCGNSAANLISSESPALTNICLGGAGVLNMGVSVPPAGVGYTWLRAPSVGGTLSHVGQTGNTATFNTGIFLPLGSYFYRGVAFKNGCTDTTGWKTIVINTDPVVATQPVSVRFCAGNPLPISSTYGQGTSNVNYQWESAAALAGPWVPIAGATTTTLIPASTVGTTFYRLQFIGNDPGCQTIISNPASAAVDPALSITTEPQPLSACVGGTGTLSVGVNGTGGLFRWQRATSLAGPWNNIAGATQSTYFPSIFPAGVNYYRLVLTSPSGFCRDTSVAVAVTAANNQVITVQPRSITGCGGTNNVLSVTATGGVSPLTYQWQSTADPLTAYTNIPGATSATYNPGPAGNGLYYRVIVSSSGDGCFDVQSNTLVTYDVISPVSITTPPKDLTQCVGSTGVLNVTGVGSGPIDYQWQAASATTGPWTDTGLNQDNLTPPSATAGTQYYRVILSSGTAVCKDTSAAVAVNNVSGPAITQQPAGYSTCQNGNTPISVAATGGTGTLTYQWQVATSSTGPWNDITGATGNSHNPGMTSGSRFFRVLIGSGGNCGTTTSEAANVVVDQPVTVATDPQNADLCSGGSQTLTVTATGGGVQYQWQSSSAATGPFTDVAMATQAGFTPPTTSTGVVHYRAVVRSANGLCRDTSAVAALTVVAAPSITAQPTAATGCNLASTLLSAAASGGLGTLTYQWQRSNAANGTFTDIAGASAATYNPGAGNGQFYRMVVKSTGVGCSDAVSNAVEVNSEATVSVTGEPQNIAQCVNGTQTFSVNVPGTGLVYQWQTASAATGPWSNTGSNQNSFAPPATTAGTAFYRLLVRSAAGFCADTSATVSALTAAAPAIGTQPVGATACQGSPLTALSAIATGGTGTLTYQWQSANAAAGPWTDVSGATNTAFTPTSANAGSAFYRVVVSSTGNGCAPATSNAANITVEPAVTAPATASTVTQCVGGTQAFAISGTSTGTINYQWQEANAATGPWTNVPNTTNTFTPPATAAGTTYYRVVMSSTGGACKDTSEVQTSVLTADPAITTQPTGSSGCGVANTNLTVAATGGIGTLTYQWQSAPAAAGPFADIAGATTNAYNPGAAGNGLFFRVLVKSSGAGCTDATSNVTSVNSDNPVTVTADPQAITQCVGGTQTMTVAGSGNTSFNYQWQSATAATGPWSDVGTNQNTFAPPSTAAGTAFYRAIISSPGGFCKDTSTAVSATISAPQSISTQPAGYTTCLGTYTPLSVAASGGIGTLTYQWQSALSAAGPFSNIAGATNAAYTPTSGPATQFFRAQVSVSNPGCPAVVSDVVTVVSEAPVGIATEPQNVSQCTGGTVALSARGNSTGAIQYQWQQAAAINGPFTDISGANTNTYTPPTTAPGTQFYRLLVRSSNGFCKDTSTVASSTVVDGPAIATQPANIAGCGNNNAAALSIVASGGTGTFTYQWQSAASATGPFTDVTGATSATYLPPAATGTRYFRVQVGASTSGCAPVISNVASVVNDPAVSITTEPQNLSQCAGGTTAFSVAAGSTGALQYQWQQGTAATGPFTDIATATTAAYTPVTTAAGTTYYRLIARSANGLCRDTSVVATSVVLPGLTITTQPIDLTGCGSGTNSLTVAAAGGTGAVTYQWQSATSNTGPFTNIAGATTASYTPGLSGNGLFYRAIVKSSGGGCADATSNVAAVNVSNPVVISSEPQALTQCVGGTAVFTVTANGTGLIYQWQTAAAATGPWTNTGTGQSTFAPPATVPGSVFYRAIVGNAACRDTSAAVAAVVVADPVITTQPANFSGCLSGAVSVSVAANGGTGALTYQWQSASAATGPWTNVTGAVNSSYSVAAVTGTTFYRAVVSAAGSGCDGVTSAAANVTLDQLLSITTDPQNITQCVGGTAPLTVAANSSGTVLYEWQSATAPAGPFTTLTATAASFTPPATAAGATYYRAILRSVNGLCRDTSKVALATVVANAVLTTQPADFSACAGSANATLSVAATGGIAPLQYQWQSATAASGPWNNVAGATGASFIPPAATGNVFYRAVVSSAASGCTAVNSNPANVLIEAPVTITADPQPLFQCVGGTATLSVTGSGAANLNYQWQAAASQNGPFSNVGTSQNTFAPPATTAGIQYYRAIVVSPGGFCRDTSAAAPATIASNPAIATQPQGLQACVGGQLTLSSAATGGVAPLLQWQSAPAATGPWTNISGATQPNYNPPLTNSGTVFYRMTATSAGSGCTAATSDPARVVLHPQVDIATQPQNVNQCVGGTAALTVVANGGTALSYQWQSSANGQLWQNIAGATAASYTPPSAQNSTRRYRVVVHDALVGCGADSSAAALVVVNTDFQVRDTVEVCNVVNGSSTALVNFGSMILRGDANSVWVSLDTIAPAGAWTAKDFTAFTPGRLYRFVATTTNAVAPCINVSDTLVVRVKNCCPTVCTNAPTASLCNSGAQPLNLNTLPCSGTEAGSWTLTAGPGITGNTPLANGQFDASGRTPGAYTVRYALLRSLPPVCAAASEETITVAKAPEAGTLTVPSLSFCDSKDTLLILSSFLTGADANGTWTETSAQGSAAGAFAAANGTLRTNPLTKGSYSFRYTVPAVAGCAADAVTLSVQVAATPTVKAGTDARLTCEKPETLLGDAAQGQNGVVFEWKELLKNVSIVNQGAPAIQINEPGLYRIQATDSLSGCFAADTVVVTAAQNFITDLKTDFTDPLCFGAQDGSIEIVDITGGTAPFRYTLNGSIRNTGTFRNLKAGVYTVRVQDKDGCATERTIELEQPPLVSLTFNTDTTVFCGDPVLLKAVPGLDTKLITSIRWTTNNRIAIDSARHLQLLVKPEQNVTYSVVIADKNGCSGTATVRIRVQEEFPVYAPNVFAPESNDANGIFQLYSSDRVKTIKMFQVFDRGGSLVYEQRNAAPNSSFGWDGMYRGRLAAPGVYVFHAVLEYCTGKEKTVKGEVTLVR